MQRLLDIIFLAFILIAMYSCKSNIYSITSGSVTDIDGNVYDIVKIGSQRWMKQNLKASHFRDGVTITEVEDSSLWTKYYKTNSQNPVWCYYNGNRANNALYGKLYNWYAVVDSHQICPIGWHLPSDSDWIKLSKYLGGFGLAGGHMKALKLWDYSETNGADNLSGFTAFPSGGRSSGGQFGGIGTDAAFWIYLKNNKDIGYCRYLFFNNPFLERYGYEKGVGFSVRCIGD